MAGAAQASTPGVPDPSWNEIFVPFDNGLGNTMCVDVPGGSTSPGALLQLYHCHGYASDGGPQRWQFINMGPWYFVGEIYQTKLLCTAACA